METNHDITCELCGGTNFYTQDGNYYCSECQQLSQDVRELVFDVPEETVASRSTSSKRIRKEKKEEDQLTSWECYNYVLLGLVNELIELGAVPKLKRIVEILWFKYLKKLEVISEKPNALPRLSAVNSQKDAEIIYGRNKRKRKRSSRTPSPSSASDKSTTDCTLLKKERAKQRRSMVLAEYDQLSSTMKPEEMSPHNQSLVSLRSGSDSSKAREEKYVQFNHGSKKELLKIMTKHHLRAHCRDVDSVLQCHKKIPRTSFSTKFTNSYEVLSRSKIYALIYLGLLINKDKIQLGDMLRFIREGHLSYHSINHFFPDDCADKVLNIKSWDHGNNMLCHFRLREIAADIAKNLKITRYIPCQDLTQLCRRYCMELNLPDEAWGYTLNLMSKVLPKMNFTEKSKVVPNYEGRAMSFIIFFIKLVYGLDEVTEEKFSSYAKDVNKQSKSTNYKMFVWNNWVHHITYRKLLLSRHHFPTQHLFDNDNIENAKTVVDFITEQNIKHEMDHQLTREAEVLKQLLEKLKDRQPLPEATLQFSHSLTPFRDYIKIILDSKIAEEHNYLLDVLNLDFKNYSFNFLINPIYYLEQLDDVGRVGIKHRGANNNLKIIKIPNPKVEREQWRKVAKKTLAVRISRKDIVKERDSKHLRKSDRLMKNIREIDNSKEIIKNFEQKNMRCYTKNLRRQLAFHKKERRYSQAELEDSRTLPTTSTPNTSCSEISSQPENEINFIQQCSFLNGSEHDLNGSQNSSQGENVNYLHYNPFDRYWLKSVSNISREEFREFMTTLPNSFQLLLNECSRITEQSAWELFDEFLDVEIYLSYVAEFMIVDKKRDNIVNKDLKRFINKAKNNW